MASAPPPDLRSAFRPTYNLAVNLVSRFDRETAERRAAALLRPVAGPHAGSAARSSSTTGSPCSSEWATCDGWSADAIGPSAVADLPRGRPPGRRGARGRRAGRSRARRPGRRPLGRRLRAPPGPARPGPAGPPAGEAAAPAAGPAGRQATVRARLALRRPRPSWPSASAAIEELHLVPRTRQPAPGLATAVASWARGASFATALGVAARDVGELAPGDFVRTMKSVADLAQQVSHSGRGHGGRRGRPRGRRPRAPGRRGRGPAGRLSPSATAASPSFYGYPGMFPYSEERFTADEEAVLRRYVTNLDQPVFALVNLPEVVKGALFARYSRSPKSLRRLFLDEFVGELDISGDATVDATVGLRARRAALREGLRRIRRRLGGPARRRPPRLRAGVQRLSKVLEWGRLMAYLEQSTRYIAYNHRLENGHYRYFRPPEILDSPHGARYVGEMDRVFDTYGALLPRMQAWVAERFPQQAGDSDFVYRQATRAKSLDALRGLLPAASLSNIGIYGTGQSYEQLLLRMRAHPLPEARHYADMMLNELRKVIPSFLQRVDVPERGGEWSDVPGLDARSHGASGVAPVARAAARSTHAAGTGGRRARRSRCSTSTPTARRRSWSRPVSRHLGCSEREAARRRPAPRPRRPGGAVGGLRRRSAQSPPPTRTRLRAHRLPLRARHRLRRVPRPAAAPDAHDRVAASRHLARVRHARARRRRRPGRALRRGHRSGRGALPLVGAGLPRAGVVRRRAGPPHPLRHAVQRARGHAPHRAALRARRATPRIGGWPSRCTGPSPRWPGTAPWPRR